MQVNFFATFRNIVGKKTVYFDLTDNIPVAEFLQAVIDAFPGLKKHLMAENGQLLPYVHLFINGHDVQLSSEAQQTPLHLDDKIDIFPPIAGGSSPDPTF